MARNSFFQPTCARPGPGVWSPKFDRCAPEKAPCFKRLLAGPLTRQCDRHLIIRLPESRPLGSGPKATALVSHGFSNLAGRTMPEVITPLALSPKAAAAILSISRRKLDLLIADGVLKARKDGSRTLVDYQSVKAYYEGLPAKISVSIPNSPQAQR